MVTLRGALAWCHQFIYVQQRALRRSWLTAQHCQLGFRPASGSGLKMHGSVMPFRHFIKYFLLIVRAIEVLF